MKPLTFLPNHPLPNLPIPPLSETTERYLQWVKPLLSDKEYETTSRLTQQFAEGIGKELQQDLQDFAQQHSSTSWLHDAWFESYLSVREAPPLSTSGGFMVQLELPGSGLQRIAHFIHRFSRLCADYLNGDLAANTSNRGEPLDMRQWQVLQGMTRIPDSPFDRYTFAPLDKQARYGIVTWYGQQYLLPLLDANHQAYPVNVITEALAKITQAQSIERNSVPVIAIGLAGSEKAKALLDEICKVPQNADALEKLNHSLLHIHLNDDCSDSHDKKLNDYTFLNHQAIWAYKPITLCADTVHDELYFHIEHSPFDGGTIQSIVERVETITDNHTPLAATENFTPQALSWSLSKELIQQLAQIQQNHNDKAKHYYTKTVAVNVTPNPNFPERISQDAILQFIMQYAQLETFGNIKNTYESVDVSHFQAGRTECIRPVSCESVAFVKALAKGEATTEHLIAANNEHKNRIKACKRGHGVNRHLFGLQLMAKKRGISPDFFVDVGYQRLTTDNFSTSSLGNRWHIGDFSFTPTAKNGLGISYFTTDSGYWFCISYLDVQKDDIEHFAKNLQKGCDLIYKLP